MAMIFVRLIPWLIGVIIKIINLYFYVNYFKNDLVNIINTIVTTIDASSENV